MVNSSNLNLNLAKSSVAKTTISGSQKKTITVASLSNNSSNTDENQSSTGVPAFSAQTYAPTTTNNPVATNALIAGQLRAPVTIPNIGTGGIGVFGDGKGIESTIPYSSIPNTSPMQSNIWPQSSPLPHIPFDQVNKSKKAEGEDADLEAEDKAKPQTNPNSNNQNSTKPNSNPQSPELAELQAKNEELQKQVTELSQKVNGTAPTSESDSKSNSEKKIAEPDSSNLIYGVSGEGGNSASISPTYKKSENNSEEPSPQCDPAKPPKPLTSYGNPLNTNIS